MYSFSCYFLLFFSSKWSRGCGSILVLCVLRSCIQSPTPQKMNQISDCTTFYSFADLGVFIFSYKQLYFTTFLVS